MSRDFAYQDDIKKLRDSIDGVGGIYALAVESVQERAIEQGNGYNVSWYGSGVLAAGVVYLLLRTPATGTITHTFSHVIAVDNVDNKESNCTVEFFEGGTVTSDGDVNNIIVANYNRNSSNTLSATVKSNPTVTSDGTSLIHRMFTTSQQLASNITFQLKPSTDYIVKLINSGGVTINYSINSIIFDI